MNKTSWSKDDLGQLYETPFIDLIHQAHLVHRTNFNSTDMEICSLLSIKTGSCPEDCSYCPQSAHFKTGVKKEKLMELGEVIKQAKQAKDEGIKRFCMGAAWRNIPAQEFPKILEIVKTIKSLSLEVCMTLGMLTLEQAQELKKAGLDYYNHNLDTSPEYYKKIITTRTYEDRVQTINYVSAAGLNVCCGGIIGMGESREDRINFLLQLNKLPRPLKSIPINRLIAIKGTPLEKITVIDNFEFIKTIACARIMFPKSMIRLSAGRHEMSDEMQVWCFMAGANSVFYGDILLTAKNSTMNRDKRLFKKIGVESFKFQEN